MRDVIHARGYSNAQVKTPPEAPPPAPKAAKKPKTAKKPKGKR